MSEETMNPYRMLLWALLACWLLPALAQTGAGNITPRVETPDPWKGDAMNWQTECVGRVLMDFPQGPREWTNEFDSADVKRLPQPLTEANFWRDVETARRLPTADSSQDIESSGAFRENRCQRGGVDLLRQ